MIGGIEERLGIGIIMSVTDKVTAPLRNIRRSMGDTEKTAERLGASMMRIGGVMTGAGAAMTGFSIMAVKSTVDTQRALGELASLGIKDLKGMEAAARDFSNQWGGITKPAFIKAAYDIKSGIESLSDTAVGEYTKIAALTGVATKAGVEEMTDLFKTGYGIYKGFYDQMSDFDFGKMFSGGIAQAVQSFATTGPEMKAFIETLGATGTTAGIGLGEQLAAGGMLQATMSGAEAGTAYQSFLFAAAEAGQKLGLNFLDANNQLLPMAEILKVIRGRFGNVIDAVEKIEIEKAFGRKEALRPVELLIGKIPELERNINNISTAMAGGTAKTREMAEAIQNNLGVKYDRFKQRISNTMEVLGNAVSPIAISVLKWASDMVLAFQKWAEANPQIIRFAMSLISIAGAAMLVIGPIMTLGGLVLLYKATFAIGVAAIGSFLATIGPAILIIGALAGAAYLLYNNWDSVLSAMKAVWGGIVAGFKWMIDLIVGYYKWLFSLPGKLYEAGRKFILAFYEGIKSVIALPIKAVESMVSTIKGFFHSSEPKYGPLRGMAKSGEMGMQEYTKGMLKGAWNWIKDVEKFLWNNIEPVFQKIPSGMIGSEIVMPKKYRWGYTSPPYFGPTIDEIMGFKKKEKSSNDSDSGIGGLGDILGGLGGLGGGGGGMVINNYYTNHIEPGSVVLDTGDPAGSDFDSRVEDALDRLLRKAGMETNS